MPHEAVTRHLLTPRAYPRTLALVVPMFNEGPAVPFLRRAIQQFARELRGDLEVVLVNDGSSDGTLDAICAWAAEDRRIKVIHLSRNFGHQLAATAGLDYANGDAVVLIDADLQDPLEVIHGMIERYCEGYDVAYGQRLERSGESPFKRFTAWAFYRLMRAFVYNRLPTDTGDFRLLSRDCLMALRRMRETHRFLRGMATWVGYPQIAVPYRRAERSAGSTKYPLHKMLAFAWTAATSFSTLPLKLSMLIGVMVGLFGIEEAIRALVAFMFGWVVPGWTSLTIIICMIGSSLLMSVGVLGEYVGKLYEQSKDRPLYLVSRTFNVDAHDSAQCETLLTAGSDHPARR